MMQIEVDVKAGGIIGISIITFIATIRITQAMSFRFIYKIRIKDYDFFL